MIEKTWDKWKTFFARESREAHESKQTVHLSDYAARMKDFHANVAIFAKSTQGHTEVLTNLAMAAQSDREAFITLTATNTRLAQKLIDVNLKLTKAYTEVAHLKNTSSDQSQTHMPLALNPSSCCWSHGYKVCVGHISSTCTTKKEGHRVAATRAEVKGGERVQKKMDGMTGTKVRGVKIRVTNDKLVTQDPFFTLIQLRITPSSTAEVAE